MPDDLASALTRLGPRAAVWLLAPILVLNFAIGVAEIIHPAPIFNDGLLHLHQVERMDLAWERGESIIDHWDETLGLGYPFTRTYAYFSHLTIWGLHRALGEGRCIARHLHFFGVHGLVCMAVEPVSGLTAA